VVVGAAVQSARALSAIERDAKRTADSLGAIQLALEDVGHQAGSLHATIEQMRQTQVARWP
jgi:hypothetical protein